MYAIFFISDQQQPWPYLALFSHNTSVTDGRRTNVNRITSMTGSTVS